MEITGTDTTKHRHYINGFYFGDGLVCYGRYGLGVGSSFRSLDLRGGYKSGFGFGSGWLGSEKGTYEKQLEYVWRML